MIKELTPHEHITKPTKVTQKLEQLSDHMKIKKTLELIEESKQQLRDSGYSKSCHARKYDEKKLEPNQIIKKLDDIQLEINEIKEYFNDPNVYEKIWKEELPKFLVKGPGFIYHFNATAQKMTLGSIPFYFQKWLDDNNITEKYRIINRQANPTSYVILDENDIRICSFDINDRTYIVSSNATTTDKVLTQRVHESNTKREQDISKLLEMKQEMSIVQKHFLKAMLTLKIRGRIHKEILNRSRRIIKYPFRRKTYQKRIQIAITRYQEEINIYSNEIERKNEELKINIATNQTIRDKFELLSLYFDHIGNFKKIEHEKEVM